MKTVEFEDSQSSPDPPVQRWDIGIGIGEPVGSEEAIIRQVFGKPTKDSTLNQRFDFLQAESALPNQDILNREQEQTVATLGEPTQYMQDRILYRSM